MNLKKSYNDIKNESKRFWKIWIISIILIYLTLAPNIFPYLKLGDNSNTISNKSMESEIFSSDLNVPFFSQKDLQWADDDIFDEYGVNQGKIKEIGCAMTSSAMVLKYYGVNTDPGLLNDWLNQHNGYASGGLLYWSKPAEYSGGMVTWIDNHLEDTWFFWDDDYNDYYKLKSELDSGYPVIVQVDSILATPELEGHWVVVTNFLGGDIDKPENYKINDPWDNPQNPNKLLSHYYDDVYKNTIFSLRFYHGQVAQNNAPNVPSNLNQYKSNGYTTIPEGGTNDEDSMLFKANVVDPDGDDVYLEIELRQFNEPFQNQPTSETISDPYSSGSTISVSRGWLSNGAYHWQCRARDSEGAYSDWIEFGNSGNVDFYIDVHVNNAPSVPYALQQLKSDWSTYIPEGGTTDENTVVIDAIVTDPDGDDVVLEIELRQFNEPFQYQPTSETISDPYPSGSRIYVSRGWLSNADYHWQCRARDSNGAYSGWVEFGSSGNIDFTVDVPINNPPSIPGSLKQYKSDGFTTIPEGGVINEDLVVFQADIIDPDGDDVYLEIELREFNEAFQNQPTPETISGPYPSGSTIAISRGWLSYADYHWQCRAQDSNGAYSGWVEFGSSGNIDFTIAPLPAEPLITSSLTIMESYPFYIGDTITGEFSITNEGTDSISFEVLTIGGRDPDGQTADFTWDTDITLNSGESYDYIGTTYLTKTGDYHFFCAYKLFGEDWNTAIPTIPGILNTLDINVQAIIQEPIISQSLEIYEPGPYYVGNTISAGFSIINYASNPVTFEVLTIGGRDPDDEVADFLWYTDIILNPGEQYNYQGSITLRKAGSYHFFCTYKLLGGDWNTAIPTEVGVSNVNNIWVDSFLSEALRVGTTSFYDIDPHFAWDSSSIEIIEQVSEGLYAYDLNDPNLNIIPRLALDHGTWSTNGLEYTVLLRQGITFHDGTPFDAYAVKFSFDRLLNFITDSGGSGVISQLKGLYYFKDQTIINRVEVINAYTVKFILNNPYSAFQGLLCFTGSYILSPSSTPFNYEIDLNTGDLIGTGPFMYDGIEANKIKFHAFNNYWREKAKIDEMIFYVYNSQFEMTQALLSHKIHYVNNPMLSFLNVLEADPTISLIDTMPSATIYYLGMNNKLINVDFRKAISYAIDYNYIIENIMDNHAFRLRSPIPEGILYSDYSYNVPELNLIYAREIMQSMGFGQGYSLYNDAEWIATASNNPFATYKFTYNPGFREDIFYLLEDNLAKIGIKVQEVVTDFQTFLNMMYEVGGYNRDMLDMFWIGWGSDFNDPCNFIDPLFTNKQIAANGAQVSDDLVQQWMEEALSETNPSLREDLYKKIQKRLIEEVYPHAWGYVPINYDAYSNDLKGFQSNPLNQVYFYPCYLESMVPHPSSLFDGMFMDYSSSVIGMEEARVSYSQLTDNLFHVTMSSTGTNAWFDVNKNTRFISNPGGDLYFPIGTHTMYWIFTDAQMGDEIPILVDGEGDHMFIINGERNHFISGIGTIEVWVLEGITEPGSYAWYEKNTGILIKGEFYYNNGNYFYELELIGSNAIEDVSPPDIVINDPTAGEVFGENAPTYSLVINDEGGIDMMWYTLDGGVTNQVFTELTGSINQGLWDICAEGTVNIEFYAKDLAGNIGHAGINIIKELNQIPNNPINLYQLQSDGTTIIQEEGMTFDTTIIFKSYISDPDGDHVRLEIELREYDQPFTGQALLMSDFVPSGSEVIITRPELVEGDYHWQYRVMDYKGSGTEWKEYGIEGNVDFNIKKSYVKFELSDGWQYNQLFTPKIRRTSEDPRKLEIGIGNKRDMWYLLKFYRRFNGGAWMEFEPIEGRTLYFVHPYGEYSFEYVPESGEEIRIKVLNDLNDDNLMNLWWIDFLMRVVLGCSFSPAISSPVEIITKITAFINEFAGLGSYLATKQYKTAAIHFIKMLITSEKLRNLFSGIIYLFSGRVITAPEILLKISPLAPYITVLIHSGLWSSLIVNTNLEPFLEEVSLKTKLIGDYDLPNMIVAESLEIIESPYYTSKMLNSIFTIKNTGMNAVNLKSLTVGGRGPDGSVRDFTIITDITIASNDIYVYHGHFIPLESGLYHFFIAYETYSHEWVTNVPTEAGIINYLDIMVEPIPEEWKGAIIESPVELRAFDSQGRKSGSFNNQIYTEIPNSYYYEDFLIIFYPDKTNDIFYELEGLSIGLYNITILNSTKNEILNFTAINIPVIIEAIHQYVVNWDEISQGGEGTTIYIDSDGDGTFEEEIIADNQLTSDEFALQTDTIVDFDPDTLNKKSKGKWVTVYIELPNGFDVNTINLETVMLNGEIYAESNSYEIGDHDYDGICDLLVKFNRAEVNNLLSAGDDVEIMISGNLADGRFFKGTDTIRVLDEEYKNNLSLLILTGLLISMILISLINKKIKISVAKKKISSNI